MPIDTRTPKPAKSRSQKTASLLSTVNRSTMRLFSLSVLRLGMAFPDSEIRHQTAITRHHTGGYWRPCLAAMQGSGSHRLEGKGQVESRTGAPASGSGGLSVAFAPGLSPAPVATFPVPAHRTQRADFPHWALQWDHASRARKAGTQAAMAFPVVGFSDDLCGRCTASTPRHASFSARHRACSRLDGAASFAGSSSSKAVLRLCM